jgi:diacylglycerol kinase family enzyme
MAQSTAPMTIILNAKAGVEGKEDPRQRIEALLAEKGLTASIRAAQSGEELIAFAKQAVAERCPLVVAGGGDGTINAVASTLLESETTLGVIPLGTLNHFAGDLKIPKDLEGAMQTLLDAHVRQVDVGEVNGRIFLNNSSLGLYPDIVAERLKHQREGLSKWPAFGLAALGVMGRFPLLDVRLDTEKSEKVQRTPFVFVGNNEYQMEGAQLGQRTRLDAGALSLYSTKETSRLGLVSLALGVVFRGIRNQQALDMACVKEVWIHSRHHKLRVSTDGEITPMNSPFHYRVRPGALRVIAPRPTP